MKAVIAAVLAAGAVVATPVFADAEADYKKVCAACHDAGVSGAPKLGDKAAWGPRVAKGLPELMKTVMNGSKVNPAMMPKGGSQYSEAQLKAITEFMVAKAK